MEVLKLKNLFPERFTELLNESDMTYVQIAEKLGFRSKGTISKYANGKNKKIDISIVVDIANLFNVSPVWLIGLTDDRNFQIK